MDGTMRNRRGVNLQRDSRASNSWLLNDCEEAEQIQSTINRRSGNTNTTQNSSSSAVSFPIPILTYEDLCQFCSSLLDSLKEFITQTFSFSNTTPSISPKTQSLMDDFKKFGTTGYDSTNPIHEKTLQKYWDLCCPEKTLISRKSEQWKTLGFQGTDPATDFRGAGIFGLRCLVYFAITYPRAFDNLRNVEKSSQQEMYPFSIAGLNIVMIIFEFLGWGFKRIPQHPTAQRNLIRLLFETHCDVNIPILEDSVTPREPEKPVDIVPDLLTGAAVVPVKTHTKDLLKFDFDGDFDDGWTVIEEEDENSVEVVQEDAPRENNDMSLFNFKNSSTEKMFYELFCYSFIQLHENWFARDCVAYMDFPVVLNETTDKLRGLLIADSFTVQSLQAFLQTHNS